MEQREEMKMIYKKLFSIEYNNKKFMLFLAENNRITFLEINEKGKYIYPLLEDFLSLNKMYNEIKPYVFSVPKFKFTEKVRTVKSGIVSLLSVVIMLNSLPTALASEIKTEVNDEEIIISSDLDKEYQFINITDTSQLNEYLGNLNVTKELVVQAINNNQKLKEEDRNLLITALNSITDKYPNIDLRIFYENVKELEIVVHTKEEYSELFSYSPGSAAHYNIFENKIHLKEGASNSTRLHEIAHTFQCFRRIVGHYIIVRQATTYSALDEGMTDKIVGEIAVSNQSNLYYFNQKVLELLMRLVDYDYEDYNKRGIEELISKCSSKYPDIDFNYIGVTLRAMNISGIYEDKVLVLDDYTELINELFKICLKEINNKADYEIFYDFISCLKILKNQEVVFDYLNQYNQVLKNKGYQDIISKEKILTEYQKYKNIRGFVYKRDMVKPVIEINNQKWVMEKDGTKIKLSEEDGIFISTKASSLLPIYMIKNYSELNSNEFWENFVIDNHIIRKINFKAMPLNINQKEIGNYYLDSLYIQIGETTNHELGFIITDVENNNLVYQSNEQFLNLSYKIRFTTYLNSYLYDDNIELSEVLNINYVADIINALGKSINLKMENGHVKFIPEYTLNIKKGDITSVYSLNSYKVYNINNQIYLSGDVLFEVDYPIDISISLLDIFEYYNILDENTLEYTFTEQEIINMIQNYLSELNVGKGR